MWNTLEILLQSGTVYFTVNYLKYKHFTERKNELSIPLVYYPSCWYAIVRKRC